MFSVLHLIWMWPRWRGTMRMKFGSNKGSIPDVRRFKKETLINDIIESNTVWHSIAHSGSVHTFFIFYITYYILLLITYYLIN